MARAADRVGQHGLPRLLAAGVAAIAGAVVVALALGGSHKAGGTSAIEPSYSILRSPGPGGLSLAHTGQQARLMRGPVWIGQTPEGPNVDSARPVPVTVPGIRVWIAAANDGGVCLLLMPLAPKRVKGPGGSCSPEAGRGATSEHPPAASTPGYIVGAVPDGVHSVSLVFAGGTSKVVPVKRNAFSTTIDVPVLSVAFTLAGTEMITNMKGL